MIPINSAGPARMLNVSRLRMEHYVVLFVFAAALIMSTYCTLYTGAATGFIVLLASGLFLICFLNFGIGLCIFIASILFSPEIHLKMSVSLTSRPVLIRTEDILSVVFLLGWIARLSILREYRLLKHTTLNWPIFLFLTVCVVSTFFGWSKEMLSPAPAAFYIVKYTQFFLIFFLVVNCIRTVEQVKMMLVAGLIVMLAFCVYAYWQIPQVEIWSKNRLTAPFSQQSESTSIGGILAFVMAILTAMLIYVRKREQKAWLFVGVVAMFIPFLYTLSRTSYLSFGFALFILLLYSRSRALAFVLVSLLLLSPIVLPQSIIDRIAYTWRDARAYGVDPSTQERLYIYYKMKAIVAHSPLIGYGVSAMDILDNQYIKWLVETGVLGLGLFLWILRRIYQTAYGVYKHTRVAWVKGFSLGYLAGFWGFIVHSFGAITFTMVRTMEMFWILTGLIFVYASVMKDAEPKMLRKNPDLGFAEDA